MKHPPLTPEQRAAKTAKMLATRAANKLSKAKASKKAKNVVPEGMVRQSIPLDLIPDRPMKIVKAKAAKIVHGIPNEVTARLMLAIEVTRLLQTIMPEKE